MSVCADEKRNIADDGVWFGEDFAVEIIKFARHLAGEFDVRLVVTSDGDDLRAWQQNINCL